MEVYLYQLFALLRADKYNIALLSGKVLISSTTYAHVGKLLHTLIFHVSCTFLRDCWRSCWMLLLLSLTQSLRDVSVSELNLHVNPYTPNTDMYIHI